MKLGYGIVAVGLGVALTTACAVDGGDGSELVSASALNEPAAVFASDSGATPALPLGPNDALAQQACALGTSSAQPMMLASRPQDAATVILLPSATKRYHLHKPAPGAPAYAKIQTADWHTTVAFGAPAGVSVTVASGEPSLATARNGSCGDELTDTRFVIHEWGTYLLTFAPDGPEEFYLSILARN